MLRQYQKVIFRLAFRTARLPKPTNRRCNRRRQFKMCRDIKRHPGFHNFFCFVTRDKIHMKNVDISFSNFKRRVALRLLQLMSTVTAEK